MAERAAAEDHFGLAGSTVAHRFRVERQVAEGGFGVVYRAFQVALDRPVALKVLKMPFGLDGAAQVQFQEKFEAEAKMIARLQHPHIVNVYDYGVFKMPAGDLAPWMALEWLDGQTLEGALGDRRGRGGRRSVEAISLLRPVLDAVAYAHKLGIAHRDIKPANIMVVETHSGHVLRMLDFGIAKAVHTDQHAGSGRTGTSGIPAFSPDYAAPEQVTFSRTGPWTDVHALGLLLTEVLTDEPPYPPNPNMHLFEQVMASPRPTPAARGKRVGALERVIAKAVALSPGERWKNAGELLAAVDATYAPSFEESDVEASQPPTRSPRENLPYRAAPPIPAESHRSSLLPIEVGLAPTQAAEQPDAQVVGSAAGPRAFEGSSGIPSNVPPRPPQPMPFTAQVSPSIAAGQTDLRPRFDRRFLYVGIAVAAIAVIVGTSYWRSVSQPGRIEITTVPNDAVVLVDNTKVGDRSPVSYERSPGPYTVSVIRDGYVRNDQNVEVQAGRPLPLAVTLEPAPDTGFELTSEPPGGLVWFDGAPIKGAAGQQARTDFRAFRIAPGHHILEIKGENRFKPWRQDFDIEPGSIAKVHAMLIPTSEALPSVAPSSVSAASLPTFAGAVGSVPASHSSLGIRRKPAHQPASGSDNGMVAGNTNPKSDDAAKCSLTIASIPWSEVWIDGRNTSKHTPLVDYSVDCGTHELSLKRADLLMNHVSNITLRPGEPFKARYHLPNPPNYNY